MKRRIMLIFLLELICSISQIESSSTPNFQVRVDPSGSYSLVVNNVTWLNSGDTAFNGGRSTFTTADNSLKLVARATSNGTDQFGPWASTTFTYLAGSFHVNTSIKTYSNPSLPAAVFSQTYIDSASDTSANSSDGVISKFPSFRLATSGVDLGYLTFAGDMAGYSSLSLGRYQPNVNFGTGMKGGPLVIFDNASNVIVISPRSKFMAVSSSIDPQKQINWGIMGHVNNVLLNYNADFLVYYSNQGVNQAIKDWGNYLTTLYQKSTIRRDNDLTIKYLGYWTDNGAYYYYNTEKGKNYEATIIDTADYINNISVPFKYIQFDSWWYPKGRANGVKTWTEMSSVFPHGFKYISDRTKLPMGCHNRYWAGDTTYARSNGGQFGFVIDSASGFSLPDDPKFWPYLFNETRKWGDFILYEQDWLDVQTNNIALLHTGQYLGERWLQQMGQAAESFGTINIQYCMSYPRHMLQSLEIPVVTQARVSGDYHPGNHQWNIGISSIFVDALNVAPFKDTFYTTERQPGDPYNSTEPNTRLQAAISTLSTGPVGPGDGIGFINKTLLMKCCDASGLILKPKKPATAIDDQIKRAAFKAPYPGPAGDVYTTYSDISGFVFGIVLAAGLSNSYSITPASGWPTVQFPASLAFSNPENVSNFSNNAPIVLGTRCTRRDFCLFYTTPLLTLSNGNTYVLLGELAKWVPMSQQRFNSIHKSGTDIVVQLTVQAKESVTFLYYDVNRKQTSTVVCDNSKSTTPATNTIISIVQGTCTVA